MRSKEKQLHAYQSSQTESTPLSTSPFLYSKLHVSIQYNLICVFFLILFYPISSLSSQDPCTEWYTWYKSTWKDSLDHYWYTNQLDKAQQIFDRELLSENPCSSMGMNYAKLFMYYGFFIAEKRKDRQGAIQLMQQKADQAMNQDSFLVQAYYLGQLGVMYIRTGQLDLSFENLLLQEKILETHSPHDTAAIIQNGHNKSLYYAWLGMHDQGLKAYTKLYTLANTCANLDWELYRQIALQYASFLVDDYQYSLATAVINELAQENSKGKLPPRYESMKIQEITFGIDLQIRQQNMDAALKIFETEIYPKINEKALALCYDCFQIYGVLGLTFNKHNWVSEAIELWESSLVHRKIPRTQYYWLRVNDLKISNSLLQGDDILLTETAVAQIRDISTQIRSANKIPLPNRANYLNNLRRYSRKLLAIPADKLPAEIVMQIFQLHLYLKSLDLATIDHYNEWIKNIAALLPDEHKAFIEVQDAYNSQYYRLSSSDPALTNLSSTYNELLENFLLKVPYKDKVLSLFDSPRAEIFSLHSDEVYIDISLVPKVDGSYISESLLYYAFLFKKDLKNYIAIPLGDMDLFEDIDYAQLGRSSINPFTRSSSNKNWFEKLWTPLLPHINGIKKIYLSTDGRLNKIPLELLSPNGSPGSMILDRYQIQYVTGDSWQHNETDLDFSNVIAAWGGLDYNCSNKNKEDSDATFRSLGTDFELKYLKGSLQEVLYIDSLAISKGILVDLRTGCSGTAERFIQDSRTQKYSIVHLATHGQYLPLQSDDSDQLHVNRKPTMNTNLRTVLYFAGAMESVHHPEFKGWINGEDILRLDLQETNLVVLSACESGIGETMIGEGDMSIARSFLKAGAHHVIAALWEVPDIHTALFFKQFYSQLLDEHKSIPDAFRDTRLALMKELPLSSIAAWKLMTR
jgi:CHAT domain-containing protein